MIALRRATVLLWLLLILRLHRVPAGMDKAMLQRFVNPWSARALIRSSPQPPAPHHPRRRSPTRRSRLSHAHLRTPHHTAPGRGFTSPLASPSRRRQRRRPLLPRRVRQAALRSALLQRRGRPPRPLPHRTRFRSALPMHRTVRNTPRTHHIARLAPHTAHTRRSPSAPLRSEVARRANRSRLAGTFLRSTTPAQS